MDEVCEADIKKIEAALRLDDIITEVHLSELNHRESQNFDGSNANHFVGYKSNTQNLNELGQASGIIVPEHEHQRYI